MDRALRKVGWEWKGDGHRVGCLRPRIRGRTWSGGWSRVEALIRARDRRVLVRRGFPRNSSLGVELVVLASRDDDKSVVRCIVRYGQWDVVASTTPENIDRLNDVSASDAYSTSDEVKASEFRELGMSSRA